MVFLKFSAYVHSSFRCKDCQGGSRTAPFAPGLRPASLCQFRQLGEFLQDMIIAAFAMGQQTGAAILYAIFRIGEVSSARLSQGIQGAIAKQAVEILCRCLFMAGIVGAIPVCKIIKAVFPIHFLLLPHAGQRRGLRFATAFDPLPLFDNTAPFSAIIICVTFSKKYLASEAVAPPSPERTLPPLSCLR